MMASMSSMSTNPPHVYEVTTPSSHKITRITAMVQSRSIVVSFFSVFVRVKLLESTQES
jgi:hypothetical protein